jgi:hypothetical protein
LAGIGAHEHRAPVAFHAIALDGTANHSNQPAPRVTLVGPRLLHQISALLRDR